METAGVRSRGPISPCPSSRVAPRCGIPPPRYNHLDDQTRTAHQRDAHHTHLALNLSVLQTVTRGQGNCREATPLKEKEKKSTMIKADRAQILLSHNYRAQIFLRIATSSLSFCEQNYTRILRPFCR